MTIKAINFINSKKGQRIIKKRQQEAEKTIIKLEEARKVTPELLHQEIII